MSAQNPVGYIYSQGGVNWFKPSLTQEDMYLDWKPVYDPAWKQIKQLDPNIAIDKMLDQLYQQFIGE